MFEMPIHIVKERMSYIPENYIENNDVFPYLGIELLQSIGLMSLNVPIAYGGKGLGHNHGNYEILAALKKIGAYDLSLGRIYEGHLNALLLIDRYGGQKQKMDYFQQATSGKLFGIWNSELPSEPLEYQTFADGYILKGAKVFCSGASNIHRPIVTAAGPEGTRMIILHMDQYELMEDMTYWKPMGMKSSVSCRFDLTGIVFQENQLLGDPYDYVGEPDFTSCAMRFAAVQLGGAEAAIRATATHLKTLKRTGAPEQVARLGRLAVLRETGSVWLNRAGQAMDNRYVDPSASMHLANMFRTVTRDICEEILKVCDMSVGLQGTIEPHPLERIHRDLSVYLKRPGPDRTLSAIGTTFITNHS